MKKLIIVFVLVILENGVASGQDAGGKLVFAIRNPFLHRDGFRAATGTLEKGRSAAKWWEFYEYNICTMDPTGTDFLQLTDDGVSRRPRWSPDRGRIAYIAGVDGAESLCVMAGDGTEKKRLVKKQHSIHDFWWSPSSDSILVALEIEQPRNQLENWIVTIDGESTKRWRTSRWAEGWRHWDAKGEKVKEPRRRLIEALPEGTKWPEWSPDRKWIAFKTENHFLALAEPGIVGAAGSWFLQRDEPPCQAIEEWSPDGKHILFYTAGKICVATVENGRFKNYRNLSLYSGWDAAWSPDARQIAFAGRDSAGRDTSEIFILDVATGNMRQITSSPHGFLDLHWR